MQGIDQELFKLNRLVEMLNYESSRGAVVVVEGKRDHKALLSIGYDGNVILLNNFKGIHRLVESLENTKVILMFDMDRKGKYLTQKVMKLMNNRNVDLYYKRMLAEITRGKIRCIEELIAYSKKSN